MQVFVKRGDLLSGQDVPVIAVYDDNVSISPTAHGNDVTVISVPAGALSMVTADIPDAPTPSTPPLRPGPMLDKNWRDNYKQEIAGHEADRRILEAFPEYSQRNSASELNSYIVQYGADSSKWPASPRERKAEIDRCWNYVNAVRTKATALMNSGLPANPTADNAWPTKISPYKPS